MGELTKEQARALLNYLDRAAAIVPTTLTEAASLQSALPLIAGVAFGSRAGSHPSPFPPSDLRTYERAIASLLERKRAQDRGGKPSPTGGEGNRTND